MNDEQLKRLMRLSQKTGTPLIVTDPSGEGGVVLMSIEQYEDLTDVDVFFEEGYSPEPELEEIIEFDDIAPRPREVADEFTIHEEPVVEPVMQEQPVPEAAVHHDPVAEPTQAYRTPVDAAVRQEEHREPSNRIAQAAQRAAHAAAPMNEPEPVWTPEPTVAPQPITEPAQQSAVQVAANPIDAVVQQENPIVSVESAQLPSLQNVEGVQSEPQKLADEPSEEQFYLEPIE